MTFSTTLTSKGQLTIPVAFRNRLGVRPGERVVLKMQDGKVIIQKDNWRDNLKSLQDENRAYLKQHGIKPLTD